MLGRLTLTVIRGRDLFPKASGNTSHPYCTVTLGLKSIEKTEVIPSTLNPEWNQYFTFNIFKPFETVEFVIHDDETGDFIGKSSLLLEDISDQQSHEKSFKLQGREIQDEVSGFIDVKLQYKYTAEWNDLYTGINKAKNGLYEDAISYLTPAILKFPSEIRLYEVRSEAYLKTKQLKNALADAVKIRDINPNVANGHYRIGQVYQAAGKTEEAKKAYNAGLSYSNRDPQILEAITSLTHPKLSTLNEETKQEDNEKQIPIAEELYNKQEYTRAIKEINNLIKQNSENGSLYLARICIAIGLANSLKSSFKENTIPDLIKSISADAILVGKYMPTWAKDNSIKMGYMKKGGEYNRFKKRRWFILAHNLLFYYKSKEELEPNGAIPISLGVTRKVAKDKFIIRTPGRDYELTEKVQIDNWISSIKKAATSSLPFPTLNLQKQRRVRSSGSFSRKSIRVQLQMLAEGSKKIQLTDRKNIVREGILYKTGKLRKVWKKRYFILKPMELYYFEDEPMEDQPYALGMINLKDCIWKKGEGDDMAKHMFEIETELRVYHLYAISRPDMYEWKAAIELCSQEEFNPSFLSLQEESALEQKSQQQNQENTSNIITEQPKEEIITKSIEENKKEEEIEEYLPDLADVESIKEEFTPTEVPEITLSINNEENIPQTKINLRESDMSNSESRYFKKFGLNPPEKVNKRHSVLLNPVKPQTITTLPVKPTASANKIPIVQPENTQYTTVGVDPKVATENIKPKTERDPLLPKNTQQQTRKPQQRKRPPKQDEGCGCNLL